jgi:hypothetical protein
MYLALKALLKLSITNRPINAFCFSKANLAISFITLEKMREMTVSLLEAIKYTLSRRLLLSFSGKRFLLLAWFVPICSADVVLKVNEINK